MNVFVNLNRCIGVDKELIPVGAQPDGSIAAWRIAPELLHGVDEAGEIVQRHGEIRAWENCPASTP